MIHLPTWRRLNEADTRIAQWLQSCWTDQPGLRKLPDERWETPLTDVLWGTSITGSFGRAIAHGYIKLLQATPVDGALDRYHQEIRMDGNQSATLGILTAQYWPAVLLARDLRLVALFNRAHRLLAAKGSHLLPSPWDSLALLLAQKDAAAAIEFLKLLIRLFAQPLTYNQRRYWAMRLGSVISQLAPFKRTWQCRLMRNLCAHDLGLLDAFMDGLTRAGLDRLSERGLSVYVSQGIAKWKTHPGQGKHFFRLASRDSQDHYGTLKTAVSLADHQGRVTRYLRARFNMPLVITVSESTPEWPGQARYGPTQVCCDGRALYLPSQMDVFGEADLNLRLLFLMAKLEVGAIEFGSFDLEVEDWLNQADRPALAQDLFVIAEHARISRLTLQHYPGLTNDHQQLFTCFFNEIQGPTTHPNPLTALYGWLVADIRPASQDNRLDRLLNDLHRHWHSLIRQAADVATSLRWVRESLERCPRNALWQVPLCIPFQRHLRYDLFRRAFATPLKVARKISDLIDQKGLQVDRLRVRQHLVRQTRPLTPDSLKQMFRQAIQNSPSRAVNASPADIDDLVAQIDSFFETDISVPNREGELLSGAAAFVYPEWDINAQDYLVDYVRVGDRVSEASPNGIYQRTLAQYADQVNQVRRVFELMRPQDLTLMRPWPEGDDFDYRAMLDFVLDRKAGQVPSERLYVKRLKTQRDLVVLVLVDLSRSTAHLAGDGSRSVLDIEKQALVLLCEAMQTVGDRFGIAGFSGHGRLGVDYVTVKAFDEHLAEVQQHRIGALCPLRSTRMGAAIRHGAFTLGQVAAKTKLLLMLGDGFPNDVDYKRQYAVADTRRAVAELRAQSIHFRAITVNVPQDPQLDRLFGAHRHTLISDVCQLPRTLSAIYRFLTH